VCVPIKRVKRQNTRYTNNKLISRWNRRTLPLEPLHRCTSSLLSNCLRNDVLASRLLMNHAGADVMLFIVLWKIPHLIYWAQAAPAPLAYELKLVQVTWGRSGSLEMAPFDRSHTSSYSSSIVNMTYLVPFFEMKRDIRRKTPSFHTHLNLTCTITWTLLNFFQNFSTKLQSVRVPKLLDGVKHWRKVSAYGATSQTDDRRTADAIYR